LRRTSSSDRGRNRSPRRPLASELLKLILSERRARWEGGQLAKFRASGKEPKDDKWKQKYVEPAVPDTDNLPDVPDGWTWATVDQVGETTTGFTPPTSELKNFGGDIPFFKPTDLDAGYYTRTARDTLTVCGAELGRLLPAGAVLVTCIGATIGKTGLARVAGATNQQINALVVSTDHLLPEWFFFCFASPLGQDRIKSNASSTTLPILNKSRFEGLAVAIPPSSEQRRIVAEIERRLSITDELEMELETNLRRSERLRQAILKCAFEGSLVPQDPNDEPASVLLERIRAGREAGGTRALGGSGRQRKRTAKSGYATGSGG
jgi:type I restriction enzyme S subunit